MGAARAIATGHRRHQGSATPSWRPRSKSRRGKWSPRRVISSARYWSRHASAGPAVTSSASILSSMRGSVSGSRGKS